MDGILNVLKPPGITSHGVVAYIRKLFGEKKVGHTGTLDPGVAGVLPLGLGKGTRVTHFLLDSDKAYRGEITFGITTDTQDGFGKVLATGDASLITPEVVREAFQRFIGEMEQVPPMTSAVRYQGKKLYELARQGLTVEPPARKVTIHSLEMVRYIAGGHHPRVLFDVTCSKGTYIRTLCHDLGQFLGCGAYLSFLIRTRSGPFRLEEARTLEEIKLLVEEGRGREALLPLDSALPGLPRIKLAPDRARAVLHGNAVKVGIPEEADQTLAVGQPLLLYDQEGQLLAVGEVRDRLEEGYRIQPLRLLR